MPFAHDRRLRALGRSVPWLGRAGYVVRNGEPLPGVRCRIVIREDDAE